MAQINSHIALLATGDEIVNGDILNTNGQQIARTLIQHHYQPGTHMVVDDNQTHICEAIQYLCQRHAILIIMGGLGPTSDDRTRFALAEAVGQPLIFDDTCWQQIQDRLNALNVAIPASNKQQCLFPQGADILANPNGTAAGCTVTYGDTQIFMLPGPPRECLPMFNNIVLPKLLESHQQQIQHRQHWLLLNVSEGSIAEKIDALQHEDAQIGYRVDYPYLEVKFSTEHPALFKEYCNTIESMLAPHIVSHNNQTWSQQLKSYIVEHQPLLCITDRATAGLLEHKLSSHTLSPFVHFHKVVNDSISIQIDGLAECIQPMETALKTSLHIHLEAKAKVQDKQLTLPNRGQKTRYLACELICQDILHWLKSA